MPGRDDSLYEVASTDAWRRILHEIARIIQNLQGELERVTVKQDATLHEIGLVRGRIDGARAIFNEFSRGVKNVEGNTH